jgi:hypothetical protein
MSDWPLLDFSKSVWKETCRVATTANITTLAGGAPNTLDGVSLALGDRILVKNQSTASQNGIYYVTTLGTGANGTWTRALDADSSDEVKSGMWCYVSEGTAGGASMWVLTTANPITVGSTNLTFSRYGTPFATPAIALGTTAAAGSAASVVRSDATIAAFDATAPVTQAFDDAAAAGSAAVAARRDHRHGMPAAASLPGEEIAYVEFTSTVTISATSEATANTIVSAGAITFTAVPIIIEAFCHLRAGTASGFLYLFFFDGATSLGTISQFDPGPAGIPCYVKRRLTPTAGSHTYSFRARRLTNDGTAQAGVGGTGVQLPGFIRITYA